MVGVVNVSGFTPRDCRRETDLEKCDQLARELHAAASTLRINTRTGKDQGSGRSQQGLGCGGFMIVRMMGRRMIMRRMMRRVVIRRMMTVGG